VNCCSRFPAVDDLALLAATFCLVMTMLRRRFGGAHAQRRESCKQPSSMDTEALRTIGEATSKLPTALTLRTFPPSLETKQIGGGGE